MTLIAPIHRRDGIRPLELASPRELASPILSRDLAAAHELFQQLSRRLDAAPHLLRRNQLDPEQLLETASRADNPSRMRIDLVLVADSLRGTAQEVDSVLRLRGHAPHYLPPPERDPWSWRPEASLRADAARLRRLAALIEQDAAPPPAPEPPAPPAEVGHYLITFRNAINGQTERYSRPTLPAALRLAREYRPFNNTAIHLAYAPPLTHPDGGLSTKTVEESP